MNIDTTTPSLRTSSASIAACAALTSLFFLPLEGYLPNLYEFTITTVEALATLGTFAILSWLVLYGLLRVLPASLGQYVGVLLVAFVIGAWVQSHILNWDYGLLNGIPIRWEDHETHGLIDAAVWGSLTIFAILIRRALLRHARRICVLIILVQSISLAILYWENRFDPAFKRLAIDYTHEFRASNDKHIALIILDSFQSDIFGELLDEHDSIRNSLTGFTFFRNAVSAFPYTYASVPSMLTGHAYDNSVPIQEFLDEAYASPSSVPLRLKQAGFDVRLYTEMRQTIPMEADSADNFIARATFPFLPELERWYIVKMLQLAFFRGSPQFIKQAVFGSGADSSDTESKGEGTDAEVTRAPRNEDLEFAERIRNTRFTADARPSFRFYHLNGVHAPLAFNENLEIVALDTDSRSDYKRQAVGALKIIDLYIRGLKEAGVFDSTMLIVVGDHGAGWSPDLAFIRPPKDRTQVSENFSLVPSPDIVARGTPLVLIKPFFGGGELQISDNPVVLTDIAATILRAAGVTDGIGPSILETEFPPGRLRQHNHYTWAERKWRWDMKYLPPLSEFVVRGFSGDKNSWIPTLTTFSPGRVEKGARDPLHIGQNIAFSGSSEIRPYLGQGWSSPEPELIWSEGNYVSLALPFAEPAHPTLVCFEAIPFLIEGKLTAQRVEISRAGTPLASWSMTAAGEYCASLPATTREEQPIRLDLHFLDAQSPKELGVGEDIRKLGAAFRMLHIRSK